MLYSPEYHYFECDCGADEHRLVFVLDCEDETEPPSLYNSVFLDYNLSFFKRVIAAVKYIFGHKSKYGHFGCWLIKPRDATRMKTMLNRYIEAAEQKGYDLDNL